MCITYFILDIIIPLDDFRALSEPYAVIARGKIFSSLKIKKYPKCEAELDKYYD